MEMLVLGLIVFCILFMIMFFMVFYYLGYFSKERMKNRFFRFKTSLRQLLIKNNTSDVEDIYKSAA